LGKIKAMFQTTNQFPKHLPITGLPDWMMEKIRWDVPGGRPLQSVTQKICWMSWLITTIVQKSELSCPPKKWHKFWGPNSVSWRNIMNWSEAHHFFLALPVSLWQSPPEIGFSVTRDLVNMGQPTDTVSTGGL
jgi:hypothetical protein